MHRKHLHRWLECGLLTAMLFGLAAGIFAGSSLPNPLNSNDSTGTLSTYPVSRLRHCENMERARPTLAGVL